MYQGAKKDSWENSQLLSTKLTAPQHHARLVVRPRLMRQLSAAAAGPVTLISAPAGFGKTMLAAAWRVAQDGRVAWLTLDVEDNLLGRFWHYLAAAFQTAKAALRRETIHSLSSVDEQSWEPALTMLINDLSAGETITLILDDYQLIYLNTIHHTFSYFLHHLPPAIHLIILSRNDPPLGLARLRVQGRLQELRARDLIFNQEEMHTFLKQTVDREIPADILHVITRRTEGWAAGLRLAAISLQESTPDEWSSFALAFDGSQRTILNYLVEEVLHRLPEEVQTFLVQTSILHHLTPGLCTAVTGRQDAAQLLLSLCTQDLFIIPLDHSGKWYRYHHLFASALRNHLEQINPDIIPDLRRRAADWYAHHGMESTSRLNADPLLDPLTERELEILALMAEGLSNRQIANQLFISVGTVKGHVTHLLSKLNAQNRTEAVIQGQRFGLL